MGDNRDNSEDSRFWGFVPFDHVVGKAILTYFSWDAAGSPAIVGQVRYGRLFRPIQDGTLLEGEVGLAETSVGPPSTSAPTKASPASIDTAAIRPETPVALYDE